MIKVYWCLSSIIIVEAKPMELTKQNHQIILKENSSPIVSKSIGSIGYFNVDEIQEKANLFYNDKLQPKVVGYRYGEAPESGCSYNTRENKQEIGVSMASVNNLRETRSFATISARENRKKFYYEGNVIGHGGDDEPLISNAKPISYNDYKAKLNSDEIHTSKAILMAYYVKLAKSLANKGYAGYEQKAIERQKELDNFIKKINYCK